MTKEKILNGKLPFLYSDLFSDENIQLNTKVVWRRDRISEVSQPGISEEVVAQWYSERNFVKFAGKHLCWSLFFNKAVDLGPVTSLKRDSNKGF